jgi:hypothetical protein
MLETTADRLSERVGGYVRALAPNGGRANVQ